MSTPATARMNPALLRAVAPLAHTPGLVEAIAAAELRFSLSAPLRLAAFLAQTSHETGGYIYFTEIWGPTPAQARYEGRTDLGNTEPGDGKRFRGRGALQITGRANYTRYGKLANLDLLTSPELAASPVGSFTIAGAYWDTHSLSEIADAENFELLTRRINGGLNGYPDRLRLYNAARAALGLTPFPTT